MLLTSTVTFTSAHSVVEIVPPAAPNFSS
eukprot:COSAG03_NODE_17268_length_378_cov_1.396429_1_plen_28_part_01